MSESKADLRVGDVLVLSDYGDKILNSETINFIKGKHYPVLGIVKLTNDEIDAYGGSNFLPVQASCGTLPMTLIY